MPIYEYECKKCRKVIEFIQKFSDSPITDCCECGTKGSLEKLMSLGSFHLKGSGWYLTDYARKNQPTGTKEKPKAPTQETPASDSKKSQESKDSS